MKKILVTGGLGFIGSHTVVELQNANYDVVVVDNLSNSSKSVANKITSITNKSFSFEEMDLRKRDKVQRLFKKHSNIEGIIHFAASKAVGESTEIPLAYYENNVCSLIYLLQEATNNKCNNFIFSSSCTVYGQADKMPIDENSPIKAAESPYGKTKQIGEDITSDLCKASSNFKAISLRYFNPVGGHSSVLIGELPLGIPQNLVPFITQTAAGIRDELSVFGDDYPTYDGTCIRDYIHVVDLAKAHIVALEYLINNKNKQNYEVFNLGTGVGNSVLEVIKTFEKVSGVSLKYKIAPRRQGDITEAYADTTKANQILKWKAKLTLADALHSAWKWQLSLKNNK